LVPACTQWVATLPAHVTALAPPSHGADFTHAGAPLNIAHWVPNAAQLTASALPAATHVQPNSPSQL
jgi:hypothetical protein